MQLVFGDQVTGERVTGERVTGEWVTGERATGDRVTGVRYRAIGWVRVGQLGDRVRAKKKSMPAAGIEPLTTSMKGRHAHHYPTGLKLTVDLF